MRVAITGGAGFIGANLIQYFRHNSPEIKLCVVDDLSLGLRENLTPHEVDLHEISVLEEAALVQIFQNVDSVVHLAAIGSVPRSISEPMASHHANSTGTLSVLEACRKAGVQHIVMASSSSVYGSNPGGARSERDTLRPMSPYAASKVSAEAYTRAYSQAFNLSPLVFRFFNVYGPRQRADHPYAAVIPRFFSAILKGEPVTIYGDGEQTRDFTHVDSVCQAIYHGVINAKSSVHAYNLAFGTSVSVLELVEMIEQISNHPVQRTYLPPRDGEVRKSKADPSLFLADFPSVQQVEIMSGLKSTFQWFAASPGEIE